MSLSNYAELKLLDHILGNTAYVPQATLYLALCDAAPTDASTGSTISETDYTNYTRIAIPFSAAAARVITNSGLITFPTAGGDSTGPVTHWAVCTAATLGEVLAWGSLAASKSIVTGNEPTIAASEVDITQDAGKWSDYLANTVLDFMFRNQAFAQPTLYAALTTAVIADNHTGTTITECSGTNYARPLAGAFGAAAAGASDNTAQIDFAAPGAGGWGTAVSCCLCDALTAGNMLLYDNDMVDNPIAQDDDVNIQAGAFDVTYD